MKYEQTNHKIHKIRQNAKKAKNKLDKKEKTISNIEDYTQNLQRPEHHWKIIREYTTEWITLDQREWYVVYVDHYKDITLELGNIPISLLPFIRFNIIYSPTIDLDNEELDVMDAFQLEDIGSDTMKKVKLWVGIKLRNQSSAQFSVKVNAYIFNPHEYC